jgi:transcriptional regulator with XRE-family HTH domain
MDNITFQTPKELQVALGARVRRLRLARNIDQRATADKAGISEKALRNLEAGRGSTVETLLRTLKALDALQ